MSMTQEQDAARTKREWKSGCKIVVPPGDTVISLVRHGMSLRGTFTRAASTVGLSMHVFTFVRRLLILRDKEVLSPDELKTVDEALAQINEDRQIKSASDMVREIVRRHWARKTKNGMTGKQRRLDTKSRERLDSTLFLIRETCTNNDEMKLPLLSSREKQAAIAMLTESIGALADLLNKIQGKGEVHE